MKRTETMRRRRKSMLLACRLMALGIAAIGIGAGSRSVHGGSGGVHAENDRWSVEATAARDCKECPSSKSFQFCGLDKNSGRSSTFVVANMMKAVRALSLHKSKCLILGELTQSGDIATLYDLEARKTADEWYGYHFRLSPDGRYLAFVKFYPRFAPPESVSDVVLVYDLGRSATENRSTPQAGPEDAGIPVFPRYNAQSGTLEPGAGTDKFMAIPPLVWAGNELRFFVRDKDNTLLAVSVDLNGRVPGARVTVRAASAPMAARVAEGVIEPTLQAIDAKDGVKETFAVKQIMKR